MTRQKKFYITKADLERATVLTNEIASTQAQLWELLQESYTSGAYLSLGFTTWSKYAGSILAPGRFQISSIAAAVGAKNERVDARARSRRSRQTLEFLKEHPGSTRKEIAMGTGQGRDLERVLDILRDAGFIKHTVDGHAYRWLLAAEGAG